MGAHFSTRLLYILIGGWRALSFGVNRFWPFTTMFWPCSELEQVNLFSNYPSHIPLQEIELTVSWLCLTSRLGVGRLYIYVRGWGQWAGLCLLLMSDGELSHIGSSSTVGPGLVPPPQWVPDWFLLHSGSQIGSSSTVGPDWFFRHSGSRLVLPPQWVLIGSSSTVAM